MPRKVFAEVCESDNLMEEFTTRAELKDDVVVLSRLREVDELDDIGMVDLSHDLDFFQDIRALENRLLLARDHVTSIEADSPA